MGTASEGLKELCARLTARANKERDHVAYIRLPENRNGWFATMSDAEIAADEAEAKDLLLVATNLPALIECASTLEALRMIAGSHDPDADKIRKMRQLIDAALSALEGK